MLLWETIDNEAEKPVYAIIVDGVSDHGARYEELQQQKYNILSTYRDYNTGDINPSPLPFICILRNSLTGSSVSPGLSCW